VNAAAANGHAHRYALDSPTPVVLAHLRSWLRHNLAGIDPNVLIDLELVCTELAANALEHATGPRHLRLLHHPDRNLVRVEVDDASPDKLPTPGRSRLSSRRGRGLRLIGALARWGMRRDRKTKTVWAELPTR
jgi:anti-sigma regulatory factor (Ser/Thr protein kinase)